MKTRKRDTIPILHVRKGATLKEIYAARRRDFTAEELQRYTQDEEMIPASEVLADLRAIHLKESEKMRRTRKSPRKRK